MGFVIKFAIRSFNGHARVLSRYVGIVISEFYYVTDLYSPRMHFGACTLNYVDVQFRFEFRTQFTKNSMLPNYVLNYA